MAKEKSIDLQNIINEGLEKPTKRTVGEIVDDILETQEPENPTELLSEEKEVMTSTPKTQSDKKESTKQITKKEVLDEILVKVIEKAKTEELEELEEQTSNIAGTPVELTDSPKFEIPDEYDGLDPGIIEYAKDDFLKHKTVDGNVYETGWVEIEDFNSVILGEKVGETITHGLDVERDKLETKIHLRIIDKQSTSVLEEIQLEINNIKDGQGVVVKHISDDNTIVATAEKGIYWVSALENKVITRTSENFNLDKHRISYKITISKPIDIQKLVKEFLTQGPRGIPLYPTMGPISTSGFFNLAKNEIVTGRPAFNGGTSGVDSPFTVDSNFLISLLNADLLDGNHASDFSLTGHNHDTDYLGITDKAADSELLDNHDSSYFSIDGHIHDDIYYTETELDNGQLDNRYYTETEHINISAGVGDANKPIKLDADGHIDTSMVNDSDIDHANLTGTHNLTTDINHDTINGFVEEEHRIINDAGTLTTELFSASKIINDLSTKSDTTHDHNADYLGITDKAADSDKLDNHDSTYFSIDGHDHNDIYYTETEIGTILGGYFKLNEDEIVTGRPAFNGGVTGASAPFTVDSTYKVDNLNADLLDGNEAAAFAVIGHDHDITYLKLIGGTLTGNLTLASGINILHSGTNADKLFYLSSDGYIKWDEAADEFTVSKYFNASSGLRVGSGDKIHKITFSTSDPSSGDDNDLWFKRDGVAADFSYALVQTTQKTANLTCSGAASTWLDYSGSPHITITGTIGEKWMVTCPIQITPGSSGYNHIRFAAVSGCTVNVDGQCSGYLTSNEFYTITAIITLTDVSGQLKLQHWCSSGSVTHTISAGAGGSASAPLNITAIRVA